MILHKASLPIAITVLNLVLRISPQYVISEMGRQEAFRNTNDNLLELVLESMLDNTGILAELEMEVFFSACKFVQDLCRYGSPKADAAMKDRRVIQMLIKQQFIQKVLFCKKFANIDQEGFYSDNGDRNHKILMWCWLLATYRDFVHQLYDYSLSEFAESIKFLTIYKKRIEFILTLPDLIVSTTNAAGYKLEREIKSYHLSICVTHSLRAHAPRRTRLPLPPAVAPLSRGTNSLRPLTACVTGL